MVDGNAGNGAAASIRGGTVVVRGDCAARAGVAMKGGLLLIEGDAGYMTGFMMQKGVIVICGDAGDALADSMYEGVVFVGGEIAALGNDAVIEEPTAGRRGDARRGLSRPTAVTPPARLRKIVAGPQALELRAQPSSQTWRARAVTRRDDRAAAGSPPAARSTRPRVIEDIQIKAELGRYRIRGFGILRAEAAAVASTTSRSCRAP